MKILPEADEYVGYRIELSPNKEIEKEFNNYFGAVRFVYNLGIDIYEYNRFRTDETAQKLSPEIINIVDKYSNKKFKNLSHCDINNIFTEIKYLDEFKWLNEINSKTITIVLKDLIKAYSRAYKGLANFPKPKIKKESRSHSSFPVRKERMHVMENEIYVPSIGYVPTTYSVPENIIGYGQKGKNMGTTRKFIGMKYTDYVNARIIFDGLHYYMTFSIEENLSRDIRINSCRKYRDNNEWRNKEYGEIVGIDLGLKKDNLFVDSNGNRISRPNQSKEERQAAGYQKAEMRKNELTLEKITKMIRETIIVQII